MAEVLDEMVSWLKRQSVSTVLLLIILWILWDSAPKLAAQVERGYTTNAQILQQVANTIELTATSQRAQEERMHADFRVFLAESRQINEEQVKLLREIIQRLEEAKQALEKAEKVLDGSIR